MLGKIHLNDKGKEPWDYSKCETQQILAQLPRALSRGWEYPKRTGLYPKKKEIKPIFEIPIVKLSVLQFCVRKQGFIL